MDALKCFERKYFLLQQAVKLLRQENLELKHQVKILKQRLRRIEREQETG